jgi:hypothetical protein
MKGQNAKSNKTYMKQEEREKSDFYLHLSLTPFSLLQHHHAKFTLSLTSCMP